MSEKIEVNAKDFWVILIDETSPTTGISYLIEAVDSEETAIGIAVSKDMSGNNNILDEGFYFHPKNAPTHAIVFSEGGTLQKIQVNVSLDLQLGEQIAEKEQKVEA